MDKGDLNDPFADDEDTADIAASFTPTPITKPKLETAKKAADATASKQGFSTRTVKKKSKFKRSDNFRTGRNEHIAVKGRLEDKQRLAAISDERDWVNGQTLQYALDALQEKIADPQNKFWQNRNFHGVE